MSFYPRPRLDQEPLAPSERHLAWAIAILSVPITFLLARPGFFLLAIIPLSATVLSLWLLFSNFLNCHQPIPNSPHSAKREEYQDHFIKTLFIGGSVTITVLLMFVFLMLPFIK